MNILWLSHFIPYPPKGGNLQRSFYLIKEVAKKNRVFLLAFNQKILLPTPEAVKESTEKLKEYCEHVQVFNIPSEKSKLARFWLLFSNLFIPFPYSVKQFWSPSMKHAIKEIICKYKIDLVHFDIIDLAQYASIIGGAKKAMNHHNVESLLLLRRAQAVRNPLKKLYLYIQGKKLRKYESEKLSQFDLNLVVSEKDMKELEQFSPEARIEVIPNGTDTEYFYPCDSLIKGNNIIFAGGMSWFPNQDAVLYFLKSIWPLAKREIPDLKLTLIGHHPPRKVVKQSHKDEIEVMGFVDDIRPLVAKATAYIVPIRVGGGTRLKILDAFACGKAVISTSIGCEGIDVTPGKNILIGDSPQEFADQIIKVCSDTELMKSLGKEGRKLVEEKYAWKIIGQRLNNLISDFWEKK
jgi:sugar transferase (PEP-CTERM/EpsH1 system associated)